ncbi:hypothetical protein MK851_01655 [Tenacibaculum sp. 1B UA]|uniref:hypothetical protein n=1 Tax=Tenacibaculum sp. 1B UA TaxID=2922252 RepID=UPI002A24211F|nr:hypothetical protein [Tenacibaculum sp. 1B UA]MDX8552330.1 hypothetical protein [Tenacibaculum sp. 1B UA]
MREIANLKDQNIENQSKTIIVNKKQKKRFTAKINGVGIVGFILAVIGLFFGWFPFLGWLIWALGFIFSLVGIFKKPRGLAIAGLVISSFSFIWVAFLFRGWLF